MSELEREARLLNEADKDVRNAVRTYLDVEWTKEEFLERVEELYDETAQDRRGGSA